MDWHVFGYRAGMRILHFLILSLILFSSSLYALKEDEMAISKDGQTLFYVERILNNGMAQVLQRFPLLENARSQLVSQQDVFGEVDSYQDATRYDIYIDQDGEFYSAIYFFTNGYVRLTPWRTSGQEKVLHLSRLTRVRSTHEVVRDEMGTLLYLHAHVDENRVIVSQGQQSSAFLRSPKGLIKNTEVVIQEERIVRVLADQVFNELFAEIRQGRSLDLRDPVQFDIFNMYASLQLTAGDKVDWQGFRQRLRKIQGFIEKHQIKPKESLDLVQVTTASGRRLQLRRLSLEEAPFRGCLGHDCSTNTRLLRALEPAHFHFIVEEIPFKPLGQIEVVRGFAEGGLQEYAFFERIQSSFNLRVGELGALLIGLSQTLEKRNIRFVMPKNLQIYVKKGGHSISNYPALEKRLEKALELYFVQSSTPIQFRRHKDLYMEEQEKEAPYNLVAHGLERKKEPVYEMLRRFSALEGKATVQLVAPEEHFNPFSPTLLEQAKAVLKLEKNKSGHELSELAIRSVCENLLDLPH